MLGSFPNGADPIVKWFFYSPRSLHRRVDAKVPRLFTKGGPYFSSRLRVDIIMAHCGSGPHFGYRGYIPPLAATKLSCLDYSK